LFLRKNKVHAIDLLSGKEISIVRLSGGLMRFGVFWSGIAWGEFA
jgi:hypothetical protein